MSEEEPFDRDAELDAALGLKPPTRYTAIVDVHTLLVHDRRVLLVHRANTGFADGMWSAPTGRLDAWETVTDRACEEVWEQLRVRVAPEDLEFVHVTHYRSVDDRLGFFFRARAWSGDPVNAEPHEHSDIRWFDLRRLPEELLTYSAVGIHAYRNGNRFSLHNWGDA